MPGSAPRLATTSAISVGVFDEAMRKILDSGRDVLYLAFSSALSTTYQSAVIAADIAVKSGDVYLALPTALPARSSSRASWRTSPLP